MASIRELCTRNVVMAARDTTVAQAAKLMRQHRDDITTIVVREQAHEAIGRT